MKENVNNTLPQFKKVRIYYFSGTGNAKHVAFWVSDLAQHLGLDCEVHDIARYRTLAHEQLDEKALIGFCSPTHGFNFPPITLRFLRHFPRGKNRVFIMNTRAGMKMGGFHLMGLSGVAQLLAALILRIKGYSIVGMKPVDLPSNWISLHPGIRQKVVNSIFERCERNVRSFAQKIICGGKSYRALLDIVQDVAIAPVSLGYYFIGRFILAKSFVATDACTNCGLCVKSCPVNAIKVIVKRPYWTFKCESCMKCINACPERAIQTAHGLIIGSLFLLVTSGMQWLYFFSFDRLQEAGISHIFDNKIFEFTLASALCIPFLWLSYRFLHFLLKFRIVEKFVVYSSLTSYKFWRRYKGRKSANAVCL